MKEKASKKGVCSEWEYRLASKSKSAIEHARSCPGCGEYLNQLVMMEKLLAGGKEKMEKIPPFTPLSFRKPSTKKITSVVLTISAVISFIVISPALMNYFKSLKQPGQKSPENSTNIAQNTERKSRKEIPVFLTSDSNKNISHVGEEEVTVLEAEEGEISGTSLEGGIMLGLVGPGKTEISTSKNGNLRLRHQEGYLAVKVPPQEAARRRITMEADNVRLEVKGTVFATRATRGRIETVEVERGAVRVVSLEGKPEKIVLAGRILHERTWTTMPLETNRQPIFERIYEGERGDSTEYEKRTVKLREQKAEGISSEIEFQSAGTENEYVEWEKILKEKGRTPEILYSGGQILRKSGRFKEAFDLFIEASQKGKGGVQEKSLFLACQIAFEKLGDLQLASKTCENYRNTYPQGVFIQEAMMIQISVEMKSKNYDRALVLINEYLDTYPVGYQSMRAHIYAARILVLVKKDCKSSVKHIRTIIENFKEGKFYEEAKTLEQICKNKLPDGEKGE